MTTEQKAKAYDEALEAARKELNQDLHESGVWAIQRIFPELRESEDENLKNKSGYYKAGKFWKASTLWNAVKGKSPQRVPNRYILQECTWNISSLQRFADEVKNVQEVDLNYPIILDINGNILDGAHRVVKAYLEGKDIDIVYLGDDEWPEPDYDEEKAVKESEDERIRKEIIEFIRSQIEDGNSVGWDRWIAYLEKQKEASKAIEAVERIDKYIDEHLANAHDMKDSNPEKKYYRGWDDALGKMAGILQDVYSEEKQKEQKPTEVKDPFSNANFVRGYESGYADAKREQKPILTSEEKEYIRTLKSLISDFIRDKQPADVAFYQKIYDWLDGRHVKHEPNIEICPHSVKSKFYKEQKPAEWSEEDSKRYISIGTTLETSVVLSKEDYDADMSWLRNLVNIVKYSRPSWKPSEEQMEAFRSYIKDFQEKAEAAVGGWNNFDVMIRLFEQLKKL